MMFAKRLGLGKRALPYQCNLAEFGAKSKRVVSMRSEKIQLESEQDFQTIKSKSKGAPVFRQNIPQDWEVMPFHQLCSLSPGVLQELELHVLKSKMSVGDEKFKVEANFKQPEDHLNGYWLEIFQILLNRKSIGEQELALLKEQQYLGRMYLEEPVEDEQLRERIEQFVNLLRFPQKLENLAEPTFCKHLLGLRRDLLLRGVDIDAHWPQQRMHVRVLKVLNYEYEFWVDAKHNRAKNGHNESEYIIEKKTIENPNSTIVIKEEWPKVDVTYITRKRKRKDYDMCFCTKVLLLVEVDRQLHTVKVEKKGPGKSAQPPGENYLVIDYDGIFRGNPTVRPIFNF